MVSGHSGGGPRGGPLPLGGGPLGGGPLGGGPHGPPGGGPPGPPSGGCANALLRCPAFRNTPAELGVINVTTAKSTNINAIPFMSQNFLSKMCDPVNDTKRTVS